MSTTYPDLTNDYPDVASDERYLYRDITIDDITAINQYESLLNAVKSASDDSTRQTAWQALETFKSTDSYTQHVYPVMMSAAKLQTLEDKVISAQRFAKRQKQQWNLSETEPTNDAQAVGDIWLRQDSIGEDGVTLVTPFYKSNDGTYKEFDLSSIGSINQEVQNTLNATLDGIKIKVVSELPQDPEVKTLYIVTQTQ